MPSEPTSRTFLKILLMLLVATIIASASLLLSLRDADPEPMMEEVRVTPVEKPTVPVTPPEESKDAELSRDVMTQIQALNAKVDRGELTREEAQVLVNELLGIE